LPWWRWRDSGAVPFSVVKLRAAMGCFTNPIVHDLFYNSVELSNASWIEVEAMGGYFLQSCLTLRRPGGFPNWRECWVERMDFEGSSPSPNGCI
jgi:hypothetical protein